MPVDALKPTDNKASRFKIADQIAKFNSGKSNIIREVKEGAGKIARGIGEFIVFSGPSLLPIGMSTEPKGTKKTRIANPS